MEIGGYPDIKLDLKMIIKSYKKHTPRGLQKTHPAASKLTESAITV